MFLRLVIFLWPVSMRDQKLWYTRLPSAKSDLSAGGPGYSFGYVRQRHLKYRIKAYLC